MALILFRHICMTVNTPAHPPFSSLAIYIRCTATNLGLVFTAATVQKLPLGPQAARRLKMRQQPRLVIGSSHKCILII